MRPGRGLSFLWITLIYLLALGAAIGVGAILGPLGASPWAQLGLGYLACILVLFLGSRIFDNSSVIDAAWSVLPPLVALYWARLPPAEGLPSLGRRLLIFFFLGAWAIRLTAHWARGWPGLSHEDWRYAEQRGRGKLAYWAISLLGFHLFPMALVFAGCLPLRAAVTSPSPVGPLDLLGGAVMLAAVLLEGVADSQMREFRARKPAPEAYIDEGLWAYSRHPNYFGEALLWIGLSLIGLGAGASIFTGLGALSILALLVFASIPMMEKRTLASRPGYAEQQRRVSMLIPWARRRPGR